MIRWLVGFLLLLAIAAGLPYVVGRASGRGKRDGVRAEDAETLR